MHVESVAWISERKDVLYSFFFLAGRSPTGDISRNERGPGSRHLRPLRPLMPLEGHGRRFPLVMMLLDFWKRRPVLERKALLEKAPFFAIALLSD